ncbi:hypothetical protein CYMTET_33936, partial [Cymbomonas tetramitiformis]
PPSPPKIPHPPLPFAPPPGAPPATPKAEFRTYKHQQSIFHSLGIPSPISGNAEDPQILLKSAKARAFRKELILIVADEHTIQFGLNLILNLRDLGFEHYLLITTSQQICDSLNSLAARAKRGHSIQPVNMTDLDAVSCLHSTDLSRGDESQIMAQVKASGSAFVGHTKAMQLRITALRARYLLRLSTLGYNVLALDPVSYIERDPYKVVKRHSLRHVRLFTAPDTCSVLSADLCCPGRSFPCLSHAVIYTQHVAEEGPVHRLLSNWAEQLHFTGQTGKVLKEGAAAAEVGGKPKGPGGLETREATRAAPPVALDEAVSEAISRAGIQPEWLGHGDTVNPMQAHSQEQWGDRIDRAVTEEMLYDEVAAWRKGDFPLNLTSKSLSPFGNEGIMIFSPKEVTTMQLGNQEWVLRQNEPEVYGQFMVANLGRPAESMPEKRFQLQAHGWWHAQAELALDDRLQFSVKSRLIALHPSDKMNRWGSAAWKEEIQRLILYAAITQRTAVIPELECEGSAERGWQHAEVVLSEAEKPQEYICNYNLGGLHGIGNPQTSLICDHTSLLSATIFRDPEFASLGFLPSKKGKKEASSRNSAAVDLKKLLKGRAKSDGS